MHPRNDRGTAVASAELALLAGAERGRGLPVRQRGTRRQRLPGHPGDEHVQPRRRPRRRLLGDQRGPAHRRAVHRAPVHPRHPYGGDLVYTAFSGSHQDAIKKGFDARVRRAAGDGDALPTRCRGRCRTCRWTPWTWAARYEAVVRVNGQSGKGGVAYVMSAWHGLNLPRGLQAELSARVQWHADATGGELSPNRIGALFSEEYLYHGEPTDPLPVGREPLAATLHVDGGFEVGGDQADAFGALGSVLSPWASGSTWCIAPGGPLDHDDLTPDRGGQVRRRDRDLRRVPQRRSGRLGRGHRQGRRGGGLLRGPRGRRPARQRRPSRRSPGRRRALTREERRWTTHDEGMATLRVLLAEAVAGKGRIAMVTGAVATGKSELLYLIAEHALDQGALPLTATGSSAESGLPLGVLSQLLHHAPLLDEQRGRHARPPARGRPQATGRPCRHRVDRARGRADRGRPLRGPAGTGRALPAGDHGRRRAPRRSRLTAVPGLPGQADQVRQRHAGVQHPDHSPHLRTLFHTEVLEQPHCRPVRLTHLSRDGVDAPARRGRRRPVRRARPHAERRQPAARRRPAGGPPGHRRPR